MLQDCAIYPRNEAIYTLADNGNIYLLTVDRSTGICRQDLKLDNHVRHRRVPPSCSFLPYYMMFIAKNNDLCLLQSAADMDCGRYIYVCDKNGTPRFSINLGESFPIVPVNTSLCLYTFADLLMVTSSEKLWMFDFHDGKYLGKLKFEPHQDGGGKDKQGFHLTGLNTLRPSEGKLVAVHDIDRCYPSVADILKFW